MFETEAEERSCSSGLTLITSPGSVRTGSCWPSAPWRARWMCTTWAEDRVWADWLTAATSLLSSCSSTSLLTAATYRYTYITYDFFTSFQTTLMTFLPVFGRHTNYDVFFAVFRCYTILWCFYPFLDAIQYYEFISFRTPYWLFFAVFGCCTILWRFYPFLWIHQSSDAIL